GPGGSCTTSFAGGRVCGFSLPTRYTGASSTFREKCDKHSAPSVSGRVSRVTSFVPSREDYLQNQRGLFTSGSIFINPQDNYPLPARPWPGGGPPATVLSPASGTAEKGTWAAMPLNPPLQDTHHRYVTSISSLIPVADGARLFIGMPVVSGRPFMF